ncbi:MAG TPA: protein-tyrosine phosphatase family protein [Pyrinomonadaceae bacterium]|nr:protein-tyrosine phosphatase family protein [Pyrinomonadaceae bacterium]
MRPVYLSLFTLMLCSTVVSAQDASSYPELPRFQQVTDRLYRGGQPRDGGLRRLRELGIDTILNLRGTSKTTKAEEAEARALGFNYFNVALPNWGRPQDGQVRRALLIIAAPQNGRVFVHCRDGVDRTGTIVALHRVTHQGWNTTDALAEAENRGMRRVQFWMRDYAEDYAERAHLVVYEGDLGDRIGAGMRFVEKGAFRAGKVSASVLRKVF